MAITLAEAKVGMADKVDQMIVDEFRRSSLLLDRLVFDNAISPGTGGSTLTYGYTRLLTEATAAFRAVNTEYTPQEATKQPYTVELKVSNENGEAIASGGAIAVGQVTPGPVTTTVREDVESGPLSDRRDD